MPEEKSNTPDYNPLHESMTYGTIWTNSLFEQDGSTLKVSRAGGMVNIRIAWSSIIWGGLFGLIGLGISWLFFIYLLGGGLVVMPFAIAVVGLGVFIGAKLGRWSPLQRTTGEDLITYLMLITRRKISMGGFGRKPSKTKMYSQAIGGEEGMIVECEQWLGTQPLVHAPPKSPDVPEYATSYDYRPTGEFKVVPNSNYRDGLGDRF